MSAPDPIRVMIADDEESVLDVLRAVMAAESDLEVAGAARDADGAIQLASSVQPDVACRAQKPRIGRVTSSFFEFARLARLGGHEDPDCPSGGTPVS
jgi:hypothetical protein